MMRKHGRTLRHCKEVDLRSLDRIAVRSLYFARVAMLSDRDRDPLFARMDIVVSTTQRVCLFRSQCPGSGDRVRRSQQRRVRAVPDRIPSNRRADRTPAETDRAPPREETLFDSLAAHVGPTAPKALAYLRRRRWLIPAQGSSAARTLGNLQQQFLKP